MSTRGRPINADVPVAEPDRVRPSPGGEDAPAKPAAAPSGPPPPQPPRPKRARRPIPGALKAIAGLVLVAIVFIGAAILGGGSDDGSSIPGAAPTPEPPSEPEPAPADSGQAPSELGYPGFATNNTTRVGGADPAANAAAVALAVYPSTTREQQPTAVALVDAGDAQTAIAAAVLMAEPIRAPPLISAADGLPESTQAALDELGPQGTGRDGVQAFAIGAAAAPSDLKTRRVEASGAAGAAAIAKLRDRLFGGRPRHVVVAPSANPAFAAPAAAWAARSGDPVLFAGRDELPKPTAAALRRYRRLPVFVLGPSTAISSDVLRRIARIGGPVSRASGESPVENAIALARYDSGEFGWNVNDPGHGFVLTRADSPLDAVAAAPLSASGTWGPLLLTDSADTLPSAVRGYLLDVKPGYTTDPTRAFYNRVWVIGDEGAIGVAQQAEVDELAELAKIGGDEP